MENAYAKEWRQWEDSALVAAGFESVEESELWRKGAIFYGRKAALQLALRETPVTSQNDLTE